MNKLISCDWGSSNFRLRLIEINTRQVLSEINSNQGILALYDDWQHNNSTTDKFTFYSNYIQGQVEALEQQAAIKLNSSCIIISGMASSNIGMMELPYTSLPFNTNGSTLNVHYIKEDIVKHPMFIVSGARSTDDVMRGEETILTGCNIIDNPLEQLYIFPGTHSKHITVKSGMATHVKTYMTGELFNLVSTKSMLSASVKNSTPLNISPFSKGVKDGLSNNFLNSLFHVRTNRLFNLLSEEENYHYLSGVFIAAELSDLVNKNYGSVNLVTTLDFSLYYLKALELLNIKEVHFINADEALIEGHINIYKRFVLVNGA